MYLIFQTQLVCILSMDWKSLKTCIDTNSRDTQFAVSEDKFITLDDLVDIL